MTNESGKSAAERQYEAAKKDYAQLNRSMVMTNTGSASVRCKKAVELAAANLQCGGTDEKVTYELRKLIVESVESLAHALTLLDYRDELFYEGIHGPFVHAEDSDDK